MILHLLLVRLAYILIILFRLGLCNTVDALDDSADFGKHLPSRAVDGIAQRQNGGFGIKAVNVRKGVLRHGAVAQTAAHCRHIDGTLRDEVGKNRRLLLRLCPFQRAADHGILQIGVQLFAVLCHKQGCLQAKDFRQALGIVLFLQGLQGRIAVGIGDLPPQWLEALPEGWVSLMSNRYRTLPTILPVPRDATPRAPRLTQRPAARFQVSMSASMVAPGRWL